MKKRFLIILYIILFLEVAGWAGYYTYDLGVDRDFTSYVTEYDGLYNSVCKVNSDTRRDYLLSIQYYNDSDADGTIGYCQFLLFKNRIRFDKEWWSSASGFQRRQLVYHELTHCYLNLGHSFDTKNYMYPFIHSMREDMLIQQTKDTLDRVCNYGL